MTGTANQSNQQAAAVAAAAEEASTGMQTVASAAEELTASIGEIGRQVAQSSKITDAGGRGRQAHRCHRACTSRGCGEDRHRRGFDLRHCQPDQSPGTERYNRSGSCRDAGKGFAVVASEVKNLANQTGKATEEIAAQITKSRPRQRRQSRRSEVLPVPSRRSARSRPPLLRPSRSRVQPRRRSPAMCSRRLRRHSEVTVGISGVSQAASETGVAAGQVLTAASDVSRQAEQLSE